MALRPSRLEFRIKGLDTHSDPKDATPGSLDLVENMWAKRVGSGGIELRKRYGATQKTRGIFPSGSISAGKQLHAWKNERLLSDGAAFYSYASQLDKYQSKGPRYMVSVRGEVVMSGLTSSTGSDLAVGGGMACIVDTNDRVTIVDLTTGERLVSDKFLNANATGRRVIALSTCFHIFNWSATGGGTVTCTKIDYATPTTIPAGVSVVTDLNVTNPRLDVVKNGSNDSSMLAYNKTVAGLKIAIWNANNTLGATATHADIPDACIGFLDWDGSNSTLYAAFVGAAAGCKYATITTAGAISSTTAVDAAQTVGRNITGSRTSGAVFKFYVEVTNATVYNTRIKACVGSTFNEWQRGMGLGGRAFQINGVTYVPAAYESLSTATAPQTGYYLLDGSTPGTPSPPVVAKWAYGLGGGMTEQISVLGGGAIKSGSVYLFPSRLTTVLNSNGSPAQNLGTAMYALDFAAVDLSCAEELGENLFLPGANPRCYDGSSVAEMGFHQFPEKPTLTSGAGGLTGTFKVKSTFEWADERGQAYESAASEEASIVLAGNNITFTQPSGRISEKPIEPFGGSAGHSYIVRFYRTIAGGDQFFLCASQQNDTSADTVTTSDGTADATLLTQRPLYETGGIKPHLPFPPARLMESAANRMLLGGTDSPGGLEVWVTNEHVSGEGVSTHDSFVVSVEADGGEITAISEDDGRWLLFKEAAIYQMTGAGPTPNGDTKYDPPTRIHSGVGAMDPRSVVKTPVGVVFKSAKGMYLLPRGASTPVRLDAIESYDSLTVTSSRVLKDLEQVRFTTDTGTTLVYHWGIKDPQTGLGTWTVFTGQAAVDSEIWNGRWTYLASDGTAQEEITAQYNDNGAAIASKARWAWFNFAGIFGEVRVWDTQLLADMKATFTLTFDFAVEFDPAPWESPAKAVTAATTVPVGSKISKQDVKALQVTTRESSTTEGFTLTGIAFVFGAEGILKTLSPTSNRAV